MEIVVVDTTVMEKAVARPTDAHLCPKVQAALLGVTKAEGITLWQSFSAAFLEHCRHMKDRQFGHGKVFLPFAGGGMHRQGQGAQALRVRSQDVTAGAASWWERWLAPAPVTVTP